MSLVNRIFGTWFSAEDKRLDENKNIDGEGTLERYNKIIASDYDDNIYPFINEAHDNLVVPRTMLDQYIINREQSLGNDYLFLAGGNEMRKRIINYWHRLVDIKGTKRCYELLFSWLGITSTITEAINQGGFDSPNTFDSALRPTFDSGKCSPCSSYTVVLTGDPLTTAIYNSIFSIINFNEPINAILFGLTYNGVDLLVAPTYNWNFLSQRIGDVTLQFTKSTGSAVFWDFDSQNQQIGDNISYTFLNAGQKDIQAWIDTFNLVETLRIDNADVDGALDLSMFTGLTALQLFNLGTLYLTTLSLPTISSAAPLAITGSNLATIDVSSITEVGGAIDFSYNSSTTTVTFPAGVSTIPTTSFDFNTVGFNGALGLDHFLFAANCDFDISNCAAIATIKFTNVANGNQMNIATINNNASLTDIDISLMQGGFQLFNASNNISLTGISFGAPRVNAGGFSIEGCSSFSGTLNTTSYPLKDIFNASGTDITNCSHASSTDAINLYDVSDCPNLTFYSFVNVEGILGANNSVFSANDCALNATEVNAFLNELATICVSLRGEVAPGTYLNRVINLGGTNAAPTGAGLTAKAALQNIGITVNTN